MAEYIVFTKLALQVTDIEVPGVLQAGDMLKETVAKLNNVKLPALSTGSIPGQGEQEAKAVDAQSPILLISPLADAMVITTARLPFATGKGKAVFYPTRFRHETENLKKCAVQSE